MHAYVIRPLLLMLLGLVSALLLAGCAEEGSGSDSDRRAGGDRAAETEATGDAAGEQVEADLMVRLEHIGDKSQGAGIPVPTGITCDRSVPATCTKEIACPVEEGDALAAVCAWLGAEGGELLLEDEPEGQVCTQIYGGPETATITGTLDGKQVDRIFARNDGCAINRFDMAAPLWTGEVPMTPSSGDAGAGGAAAGACLRSDDPDAPVSSEDQAVTGGSLADDTACAGPTHEPEVITDPPSAFDY